MKSYKHYIFIGSLTLVAIAIFSLVWKLAISREGIVLPFSGTQQTDALVVTVAGDYGANTHTDKVLNGIKAAAPAFHLTLGDFGYDEVLSETAWCNYIKSRVGELPFELLSGNHESDGQDGLIDNYTKCLPNKIPGLKGEYGKQYYFDYPATSTLVRFIMISPNLTFASGETYSYKPGTPRFEWLKNTVTEAKQKEIPWIVTLMHKNCIFPGNPECSIGPELMNFLTSNVDLILQAHGHIYTRSKQLTCVVAGARGVIFSDACVTPNKLNTVYQKGNGALLVTPGTGGGPLRNINQSDETTNYFEKMMGANILPTFGFLRLEISKDELRSDFVGTEGQGFKDTFVIKK